MNQERLILSNSIDSNILALGGQSKSNFCFVKKGTAYLFESGGNLANLEDFRLFGAQIKKLQRKLKLNPKIIACDLHPEYISTKLANEIATENTLKLNSIQHHEAHVAACIVDNKVKGDVIGIAFDGTGFGKDGNVWGGEFFLGNVKTFKRKAHLKYVPMPGGEASVKEPWRMAVSYLYNIYGSKLWNLRVDFLKNLDKKRAKFLIKAINKKINTPLTSSMGRLFDAVSSIIGICNVSKYEAQPAIELEKVIKNESPLTESKNRYKFKYINKKETIVIDWSILIKEVTRDLKNKKTKKEISLKFHNAICYMIKDVCNLLRKKYKISKVCLSGGVFQNRYLSSSIKPLLEKDGFRVYLHSKLPAHDGNISLGQAAIALMRTKK